MDNPRKDFVHYRYGDNGEIYYRGFLIGIVDSEDSPQFVVDSLIKGDTYQNFQSKTLQIERMIKWFYEKIKQFDHNRVIVVPVGEKRPFFKVKFPNEKSKYSCFEEFLFHYGLDYIDYGTTGDLKRGISSVRIFEIDISYSMLDCWKEIERTVDVKGYLSSINSLLAPEK